MSYHKFQDHDTQAEFGSFEVFYCPEGAPDIEPGWYWWACYPGCLPDGDMMGPYPTEQAAVEAAQEFE